MYVQTNGIDQVVVLRGQRLVAHNLKDGRELWRMTGMPPFPICTPVVVGDRLFVSAADEFGESDKIVVMSVRLDGNGDVTNTHNGWRKTVRAHRAVLLRVRHLKTHIQSDALLEN